MKKHQEDAFKKVIPNYITAFEKKEKLSNSFINKIKKEIKKELPNPKVSIYKKDIAKFILIHQIEQGAITNKEEFNKFYLKIGFITNNLEKLELDTISDSYFSNQDDIEDDLSFYNQDNLQNYYLNDDPNWFLQIGLKNNPFPSQDGLYLISKKKYEEVVLKTQIYNKYIEALEQDPDWILNKSIVIYGDFGCGKTTLFDYLDYKLLLKNIQPIRIILNARPSLSSLHQKFNEALFYELASYISKYSVDPRGNIENINNYSILSLFERIQKDREQIGFVIFLDGLHKSQDQKSTALNFLIELQNILEFYRRKGILLTIFIAGSLEWRDKIKNNNKFSGSIFTLEKMDPLNVSQAYEMLKRRFTVFSETEGGNIIKYNEIELLVTTIERTLATDINFRILIKYFLQNGFIFKNRIKIKPFIEEDVLNNIYEVIKSDKFLYNNLIQLKNEFQNEKIKVSNILKVISTTYDMGYFFEDHRFFQKYSQFFKYLQKKNILNKSEKYKKNKKKPFALNPGIYKIFKNIENKVKFRPTHYLELLFYKERQPVKIEAEYIKILDTIKRFRENNPEIEGQIEKLINLTQHDYFKLINKVETTNNFQISDEIVEDMKNIVEKLLLFLYYLSAEPLKTTSQTQLFRIFKYTWLDNQVLTQFFNWIEDWNPYINDKNVNTQFLKLFIDTYESLIFKIGKHILYNKILIIGSKELNNHEKIALNSARALFSEKKYKKSVEKCHDLIESTLREFIYNVLFLKYGSNWEEVLPKQTNDYIINIKRKEKKQYGSLLSKSTNSLYYLSRSAYSIIIDDDYLWENCFSILFGNAYRSFIKETLENLAKLGHLDKHNREEDEFGKISLLIQQNLLKSKEIIEKINLSYQNLLSLEGMIIKDTEIIPIFHPQEKIDKLIPIPVSDINCEQVLEVLKKININRNINERSIQFSDVNFIQDTFSMSYRTFFSSILYLIQNKRIMIDDYYGSNLIFENI